MFIETFWKRSHFYFEWTFVSDLPQLLGLCKVLHFIHSITKPPGCSYMITMLFKYCFELSKYKVKARHNMMSRAPSENSDLPPSIPLFPCVYLCWAHFLLLHRTPPCGGKDISQHPWVLYLACNPKDSSSITLAICRGKAGTNILIDCSWVLSLTYLEWGTVNGKEDMMNKSSSNSRCHSCESCEMCLVKKEKGRKRERGRN